MIGPFVGPAAVACGMLAAALVAALPSSPAAPPERSRAMPAADDLRAVAQSVLDLDALEPYYHPEAPGRTPLPILKNDVMAGRPELKVGGAAVRYVDAPGAEVPYFEFTEIRIDGDRADVRFRYPVEGLRGTAELRREGERWVVTTHELKESD